MQLLKGSQIPEIQCAMERTSAVQSTKFTNSNALSNAQADGMANGGTQIARWRSEWDCTGWYSVFRQGTSALQKQFNDKTLFCMTNVTN